MMKKLILPVVMILFSYEITANAQEAIEPHPEMRVLSFGADPCGDFIGQSRQGQEMYLTWAIGFISGANWNDHSATRTTGKSWTPDSARLWLRNYCTQHPLELFFTAAMHLRTEMSVNEGLIRR